MSQYIRYTPPTLGSGGGGGGNISGSGTATQLAIFDGANSLTSSPFLALVGSVLNVEVNIEPLTDGIYDVGSMAARYRQGNFSEYLAIGTDGPANIIYLTAINTNPTLILKKVGDQAELTFNGSEFTMNAPFRIDSGTAGAPTLTIAGSLTTGIYSSNTDTLDISAGGVNKVSIGSIIGLNDDVEITGNLRVTGTLGVGNIVAATIPGAVVAKMEIFDETGASQGFIPIYSTIT